MPFDVDGVHKSAHKVRRFLRKNPRKPSSKAIHNVRTSTRSLETTFTTLGLDKKRTIQRLMRDLGKVRKCAGKVRDMDVLTEDAMTVQLKGEQGCVVRLLEYLGEERSKYAKKLRREIDGDNPHLQRQLKRYSKRLERLLEQAGKNPNSKAIPATVAKTKKLSGDLKTPARLTKSNLHEFRLKVKELRDVLMLSETRDAAFLQKLTEVKDAIGEWHDWEELIAIAAKRLDHGPSCELLKHLRATSKSKYERALALTSDLRLNFLNGKRPQQ
jgi:CHAD domain-containing protein